jgi:hypothetical protein
MKALQSSKPAFRFPYRKPLESRQALQPSPTLLAGSLQVSGRDGVASQRALR